MSRNILYTYRNLYEFNRIYEELRSQGKEVSPFVFEQTKKLIESETDVTVDISLLVENIAVNKHDILPAFNNLCNLDDNNRVIIRKDLADLALKQFLFVFSTMQPLYENPVAKEEIPVFSFSRKAIYTYNSTAQLEEIINFAEQRNIPFFSFNQAYTKDNVKMSEIDQSEVPPIVDITTMVRAALSNSASILYLSEQLIDLLPNTIFIVIKSSAEDVLENLPIYFKKQVGITELYPELGATKATFTKKLKLRRIIDCDATQLEQFEEEINNNLIGHLHFKERFLRSVHNFVKLNKIKEKKILSIFLLGQSGIGKTEVARIIKQFLDAEASFAKINFGNYSSQDALNSLIGSPAGYVGCESGELGIKIQKSKAGVIVCDEFEKTIRPVFNFFLELLEDGSFTDSLTREYDLDGYIIVFTSNLKTPDEFYKTIPPELQSRIDLVCEFKPLTLAEKKTYVDYQLHRYMDRLTEEFSKYEITPIIIKKLANVNYGGTDDLRDIKRMVEQNVIEFLNDTYIPRY